jgi:hypothetical protein
MLLKNLAREASKLLARFASGNPRDFPQVERVHGRWHYSDLKWMAKAVRDVPGDFAEVGVFRGDAFQKVAALAADQQRLAHAFDSFAGMGEPGPEDGTQFPQGKFDIGGPDAFAARMDAAGVDRAWYRLWAGFVPACFELAPPALRFAFVILDLDHYRPTAIALQWLAPRIHPGGLLALDDFVPGEQGIATKAIREFMAGNRDFEQVAFINHQLTLRKVAPRG